MPREHCHVRRSATCVTDQCLPSASTVHFFAATSLSWLNVTSLYMPDDSLERMQAGCSMHRAPSRGQQGHPSAWQLPPVVLQLLVTLSRSAVYLAIRPMIWYNSHLKGLFNGEHPVSLLVAYAGPNINISDVACVPQNSIRVSFHHILPNTRDASLVPISITSTLVSNGCRQ